MLKNKSFFLKKIYYYCLEKMKNMTKTKAKLWAFLISSLVWANIAQGQESINSSGGDHNGTGGSVAFSIGQLVYTTNSSTSGSMLQGIQWPYEIFSVGLDESNLNISLYVFPNPTADQLYLQVGAYNNEKLSFHLFDTEGKLLNEGEIISQKTTIEMNHWPNAIYFIHVLDSENKTIRTFKIIKN